MFYFLFARLSCSISYYFRLFSWFYSFVIYHHYLPVHNATVLFFWTIIHTQWKKNTMQHFYCFNKIVAYLCISRTQKFRRMHAFSLQCRVVFLHFLIFSKLICLQKKALNPSLRDNFLELNTRNWKYLFKILVVVYILCTYFLVTKIVELKFIIQKVAYFILKRFCVSGPQRFHSDFLSFSPVDLYCWWKLLQQFKFESFCLFTVLWKLVILKK